MIGSDGLSIRVETELSLEEMNLNVIRSSYGFTCIPEHISRTSLLLTEVFDGLKNHSGML